MGPTTPLTRRALDRTLLLRQHLLGRLAPGTDPLEVVSHLLGLQAQETLPPYLALAARVEDFDPRDLARALDGRRAVRLLTMRGTVHLLTADDALVLRRWVQPVLERLARHSAANRPAAHLLGPDLLAEVEALVAARPVPVSRLGELLAQRHPGTPPAALRSLARELAHLVQVPPRGLWGLSGGVVYAHVERWLGRRETDPDVPELVRRYLAAFGPATAADLTAWSGVTRLGPVDASMSEELVVRTGPEGQRLYDVAQAPLADEDTPAPVRLLGRYDNLWLSHAARDRVLHPLDRPRWMGPNGARGNALLADGAVSGLWFLDGPDGTEPRVETWRALTRAERSELDDEVDRVRTLLRVPAYDG